NQFSTKHFKIAKTSSVLVGTEGWLYFTQGLTDLWSKQPYTNSQYIDIKNNTNTVAGKFKKAQITYLEIYTPDKHSIYPEYLGFNFIANPHSRLEQRIAIIKEIDPQNLVDLKTELLKNKKTEQLYYKADTHWNNYGSFLAYEKIMEKVKRDYPNIEPLTKDDFEIIVKPNEYRTDLSKNILSDYKDTEILFSLKESALQNKLTSDKKLEKLVVYYDSFFDPKYNWGTTNFLKYHFNTVELIENYKGFRTDEIIEQHPQVVINQRVERHL
ncbi:hypothetical protein KC980_03260, partial [candidate division WWE3 bacterium]|nr:hypothetical protein [candidate division WWE3 bacterium]